MCAIELDSSCAGNAAAAAAAAAQTDSNVCTLGKKQHKVNAAAKREIRRGSAGIRCVWLVFFFLACQCCCLCALACSPSRFFSLLALHQVHLCPDTLASFVLFSCPSLISVCVWCGYSYVLLPLFNLSLFVWGGGAHALGTVAGHFLVGFGGRLCAWMCGRGKGKWCSSFHFVGCLPSSFFLPIILLLLLLLLLLCVT